MTLSASPTSTNRPAPPTPLVEHAASFWSLDPAVTFLNHGSFGACPRDVQLMQQSLRDQMERQPLLFLDREGRSRNLMAREAVAEFVGARAEDLGFVVNATEGVNAVLRSIPLRAGQEIVTTDHAYPSVINTIRRIAAQAGAEVRIVPVRLPMLDDGEVVAAFSQAVTDRTALVVVDHITSPTALRLPVEQIVQDSSQRGIPVLVDGAHAPGMLPLAIDEIGPAYYTGNLHKWVCAPKGAAFLWVRPDMQSRTHPNTISNFDGEGFEQEFAWQGTRDPTAWYTAPAAIEFMAQFGWDRVRQHNHAMAVWMHAMLADAWDVEPLSPLDGRYLGSMASLPLPAGARAYENNAAVHAALYDRFRIEAPIFDVGQLHPARYLIRPCCQIYNTPEQYQRLAEAVTTLFGRGAK